MVRKAVAPEQKKHVANQLVLLLVSGQKIQGVEDFMAWLKIMKITRNCDKNVWFRNFLSCYCKFGVTPDSIFLLNS